MRPAHVQSTNSNDENIVTRSEFSKQVDNGRGRCKAPTKPYMLKFVRSVRSKGKGVAQRARDPR
jgi:hypothetical protein